MHYGKKYLLILIIVQDVPKKNANEILKKLRRIFKKILFN